MPSTSLDCAVSLPFDVVSGKFCAAIWVDDAYRLRPKQRGADRQIAARTV
jgi:hypothetical protein